jgi:vesicle-associated membrane protein-associated protein A
VQDPPHDQDGSYHRPQSLTPLAVHTDAAYVDTTAESIPEVLQDSAPEPAPLPVPAPQHIAPTPITAVPDVSAPITEPPTTEPPITEPPKRTPTTEPSERAPAPVIITRENPFNEELYAKYNHAQLEIERLKEQVASLSELRRRPRALSDDGSTVASDIQTIVEESPVHQEGVPLQVVVIIAFGVFIMTYLFF